MAVFRKRVWSCRRGRGRGGGGFDWCFGEMWWWWPLLRTVKWTRGCESRLSNPELDGTGKALDDRNLIVFGNFQSLDVKCEFDSRSRCP